MTGDLSGKGKYKSIIIEFAWYIEENDMFTWGKHPKWQQETKIKVKFES